MLSCIKHSFCSTSDINPGKRFAGCQSSVQRAKRPAARTGTGNFCVSLYIVVVLKFYVRYSDDDKLV